jgi:GNAT superfamily N-acetyltransferase
MNNFDISKLKFKEKVREDNIYIFAIYNNNIVGKVDLEEMMDAYWYFEGDFDEDYYSEIFPENKFIKLSKIDVEPDYRDKGIAKKLMELAMQKSKELGYDKVYLNACSVDSKGICTSGLVDFYKRFGFKELLNQGGNVQMLYSTTPFKKKLKENVGPGPDDMIPMSDVWSDFFNSIFNSDLTGNEELLDNENVYRYNSMQFELEEQSKISGNKKGGFAFYKKGKELYAITINNIANDMVYFTAPMYFIKDIEKAAVLKVKDKNASIEKGDYADLVFKEVDNIKEKIKNLPKQGYVGMFYYKTSVKEIPKGFKIRSLPGGQIYFDITKDITDIRTLLGNPDVIHFLNNDNTQELLEIKKTVKEQFKKLLNEFSINQVKFEDVFTKDFQKRINDFDNIGEYELNYYRGWKEIPEDVSDEEILNSEDFKSYIKSIFKDNFNETSHEIDYNIEWYGNKNTITLYRMMTVPDNWLEHLQKQGNRIGEYWSYDEDAAEAHWGKAEHNNKALIKTVVDEKYVDWITTLQLGMHPNFRDEKEIRLFKNTPLKIIGLEINEEQVDISGLQNKTFKA